MTKRRKRKPMPHDGVYARLQVSKEHGVGVFAIQRIKKGTKIFGNDEVRLVPVDKKCLAGLPSSVKRLYNDFSIIQDRGKVYLCPESFNLITVSWYLNHSKTPNVISDDNFDFFAGRDIKAGEELTADYDTYNEFPADDVAFKSGPRT